MIIALDYDNTYTADLLLWHIFITEARKLNHVVVFVTSRCGGDGQRWPNADIETAANNEKINIVYACHQQKAKVFKADIWIDDRPDSIPLTLDIIEN